MTLSISFLNGGMSANPAGERFALDPQGEWPPSPLRILKALVAADEMRDRSWRTDQGELEWMVANPTPTIFASDNLRMVFKRRFVIKPFSMPGATAQGLINRSSAEISPGARVYPRIPRVNFLWKTDPPASILENLQFRAARVGYLGRSDSPVQMQITRGDHAERDELDVFEPDEHGLHELDIPSPGDLDMFWEFHQKWLEDAGATNMGLFPGMGDRQRYRSSADPDTRIESDNVAAWLTIDPPVPHEFLGPLTQDFRSSVLRSYGGTFGPAPAVLHGHREAGENFHAARFIALPDVGGDYSTGRIHGLALWLPRGDTDELTWRRCQAAAYDVRHLFREGSPFRIAVRPLQDFSGCLHAQRPSRWEGWKKDNGKKSFFARSWVSATPVILEQMSFRKGLKTKDVRSMCRHAGLPDPVSFIESHVPLTSGAKMLTHMHFYRPDHPDLRGDRPLRHLLISFDKPVSGPVLIGAGRQRGIGLFAPLTDDAAEKIVSRFRKVTSDA